MTGLSDAVLAWDHELVRLSKRVRILSSLSWPAEVLDRAIDQAERGVLELPEPPPVVPTHDPRTDLKEWLERAPEDSPVCTFLARTGRGYLQAAELLHTAGTPAFVEHSVSLYGHPRDQVRPGSPTHLQAAHHYLRTTEGLPGRLHDESLTSAEAAEILQHRIDAVFGDLPVKVTPGLNARATAASTHVRLRSEATYHPDELDHLFVHEVMVHSLSKRNGQNQPLQSLGLSSPRSTRTQEGLATLAELITDNMDVLRLRRVALRIVAVDAALQGADFIEVVTLHTEHGVPTDEAVRSAGRVFRGGDVRGGVAFTKDVVYLQGLLDVHTSLLEAMQHGDDRLTEVLFAGRFAIEDAPLIRTLLDEGVLVWPSVLPDWVQQRHRLASYLSWASFNQQVWAAPPDE
ncbi:MAG: tyrosine/phenylalanine carboxypeptidase domain-containing protein [Myxococcota bacterium]